MLAVIDARNLIDVHKFKEFIKQHPAVIEVRISIRKHFIITLIRSIFNFLRRTNLWTILTLEILSILSKDARTPFVKIAKKLGIGEDSVFRRFKKLQDDGVILFTTDGLGFSSLRF